MDFRIFRETQRFPSFSRVLAPISSIVPFHKCSVYGFAGRGIGQECHQEQHGAKDQGPVNLYNPALFPSFPNSGIAKLFGDNDFWMRWPARSGFSCRKNLLPINSLDCGLIRSMFVAGEKNVPAAARSLLDVFDHPFTVFRCSFPMNHRKDKTTFGINGGMVPEISQVGRWGQFSIKHFLLFSDEPPLFVELNFFGLRGKKKPTRHERLQHASRPSWRIVSRYLCSRPKVDLWRVFHSPREDDPEQIGQYPRRVGIPTMAFRAALRSNFRKSSNESFVSASSFHSTRKTVSYHGFVYHNPCNLCSGNRKLQLDVLKNPFFAPLV